MYTFENLSHTFDEQTKPFFSNLSFKIEKGKIHSLFGQNGSGKSTLLALLQQKKKGVVTVNQRFDQMIADQFSFAENLRLAALPRFPMPFLRPPPPPTLPPFLDRFGIDPSIPVASLSGGQRQILALLMALQNSPSLLLLDEPTAAMDATNSEMVFQFIDLLVRERGITVLAVCHDETLIAHYRTGRALILRIAEDGTRHLAS